jgi:hypothetical protein
VLNFDKTLNEFKKDNIVNLVTARRCPDSEIEIFDSIRALTSAVHDFGVRAG